MQGRWEDAAEVMLDKQLDQETVIEVLSMTGSAATAFNKPFKDSVTCHPLPGELVRAARRFELEYSAAQRGSGQNWQGADLSAMD